MLKRVDVAVWAACITAVAIICAALINYARTSPTEVTSSMESRLRPTLFVHFHVDTPQDTQNSTINSLSDQGYPISGPNPETKKYVRRIEYFHKQDRAEAEKVADIVNADPATKGQPRVWAQQVDMRMVDKYYEPGQFGVWL